MVVRRLLRGQTSPKDPKDVSYGRWKIDGGTSTVTRADVTKGPRRRQLRIVVRVLTPQGVERGRKGGGVASCDGRPSSSQGIVRHVADILGALRLPLALWVARDVSATTFVCTIRSDR